MNIVEFAESILGHELLDYQKEYLNTCYECILQNKQLYYIPSRRTIKHAPCAISCSGDFMIDDELCTSCDMYCKLKNKEEEKNE